MTPPPAPDPILKDALCPPVQSGKIGVLLTNLGTPEATDYWSMRAYLREFLSDRRVIELPRLLWWFILNFFILTKRPQKKGKDYETIWNREKDEGPLKTITRSQSTKLAEKLASSHDDKIIVDWAMRYGQPAISSRLQRLLSKGCDRILLVPLYPQYSAATTATACDETFRSLMKMRRQPTLRVASYYYNTPAYINALAICIQQDLAKLSFKPDILLVSFHGMPQEYILKGDPYDQQCLMTTHLLRERLRWDKEKMITTFQSRFGKAAWLQPYTDETVIRLAQNGIKNIAVVAPGFSADCLETLEELDRENRQLFLQHGGECFAYLPALNDRPEGIAVIQDIVERELQGWV